MKQLPRACCIGFLALSAAACQSVSNIDSRLQSLELGSDTYIARAGETIESIAFRYQLSPQELATLNPGLSGRSLASGTRLYVRTPGQQMAQTRQGHSFSSPTRVRQGVVTRTNDVATTQPVYRPRAVEVAASSNNGYGQGGTVVTDRALLNSRGSAAGDQVMRNGVMETMTYAGQEIVEEEYIHNGDIPVARRDSDLGLQEQRGGWMWPTQGQIARGFAPKTEGRHGVDIAGLPGQPVVAVLDGVVAYSGKDPSGAGNLVLVRHDNNLLTAYSHTRDLYVAETDRVKAGDPIATLGANTKQESVLRFEVRQDGNALNPMEFLSAR